MPPPSPPPSTRGSVCFYAEYGYPFFSGGRIDFAGGAEALVASLARGLATRGYDVRMVTCDYGQPPRVQVDGVTLLRSFRPHRGIRGLRFFHPRLSGMIRALNGADAEVYYVCGGGLGGWLTCHVAHARRAAFVLAAASDYNVVPDLLRRQGTFPRWWFRGAVRGADVVFAQTEFQRDWFRRGYGVSSPILPNVVDVPAETVDPGQDGIVLWQGTYKAIKRPEWLLELARRLPRHRFVMAGVIPPPPLDRQAYEDARAAAAACPNLEVRGFQSGEDLLSLRRRCALVVHTSPVEGFSNVMLESWALGIPTVSAVDPDGLVVRRGLGGFATDLDTFVQTVAQLMDNPGARREAGARARAYVEERHAPGVVLDIVSRVLDEQIARVRRRRGARA